VTEFIGFTISGLVTASIFAVVACGLTLTYDTTGIFNWAQGALVAVGAFTYWQLDVAWGWPRYLAIATCLVLVGPVIGLVLERSIMFRLEGTSEATKMVVTLALLVGTLAGINWLWDPTQYRAVTPLAAGHVLTISSQRVPYNDIIVISTATVVALALRALLFRTRVGVEMRATVDDRTLATLNGISPVRTASRSWAVSSTLAVLAGVLIAPRAGLSAASLGLLIVNAYAAAVIGRLRSLPLTFVGALLLGLLTDYSQGYVGSNPHLPGSQYVLGLVSVLPVIVLFIALQFLPQARLRGTRPLRIKESSNAPKRAGAIAFSAGIVALAVAVVPLLSPGDLNSATKVWGFALVALSLVPLVGYAGRLSVSPLALAGIGAVTAAHAAPQGSLMGLLAAAVVTAVVGVLVSLTAIRLSGLYLALATAAFAVMMDGWVFGLPPFTVFGHTFDLFQGGTLTVTRFHALGISTSGDHAFFVFGALVFALAGLAIAAVRRSDFGLRLIALKDSPVGYATLGLNQRRATAAVFGLSGAIAGIGGAVLGAAVQKPSPSVFSFFGGLSLLLMFVILGVNSAGAALGAGLVVGAPALTNLFPSLSQLNATLIGLAGIGLGQDPRGIIEAIVRPRWEPVLRTRRVLLGGAITSAAAYLLTVTGVIGNYTFVFVMGGVLVFLPSVAHAFDSERPTRKERDAASDGLSAPPEMLGLHARATQRDLEVLRGA
jgi:branched-chain amino acid transport system permease protein